MDEDYKEYQTQKPNDDNTPSSKSNDINDNSNPTHPQTDTNVDGDEVYHEGLGVATDIDPVDADEFELEGDSH